MNSHAHRRIFVWCMFGVAFAAGGCATKPVDLVATGEVRVQHLSSPFGEPTHSTVVLDDHVLRIVGTIRPSAPATRPASRRHVDIAFVSTEGKQVDWLQLRPEPGTGENAGSLTYSVAYVWTPPRGTTLRIAYTDDDHPYTAYGGGGGGPGPGLVGYGGPGGPVRSQVGLPLPPVQAQIGRPAQPLGAGSPGYYGGRR